MPDLLTYPRILVGSPCKGEINRGPDDEEAVGDLMGSGSAQGNMAKKCWNVSCSTFGPGYSLKRK